MASKQIATERNKAIERIIAQTPEDSRNSEFFAKLASEFGVTLPTVRKVAVDRKLYKVSSHSSAKQKWAALVGEVAKVPVSQRRETISKLAKKHGVLKNQFTNECHKAGVDLPPLVLGTIDSTLEIIAKFKRLGNMSEVATQVGVSRQYVSQVIGKAREAGAL